MVAASQRLRPGGTTACRGGSAAWWLKTCCVMALSRSSMGWIKEEVLVTGGHANVERPVPDRLAVSGDVRSRDARCWEVCETQGDAMGTMASPQDRRLGAWKRPS